MNQEHSLLDNFKLQDYENVLQDTITKNKPVQMSYWKEIDFWAE